MKNYYKVLNVQRSSSSSEIKTKAKELLKDVKKSKISTQEKNKLSKEIFESYEFLIDYHKRKSLDDYLDSQYKILSPKEKPFENDMFSMMPLIFDFKNNTNNLEKEMNKLESEIKKNDNSYFFTSSSITTNEMDKDGNIISKTKKYTNDNGKKDKKEYNKKSKVENVGINLNNLLKETLKF